MERAPYYVWVPPYVRTSAGIRVLYSLIDALNRSGEQAWAAMSPYLPTSLPEGLTVPLLTNEVVRGHRAARRAPIAVYPEVVTGNPLHASAVVRYVMNDPGLLGGPTSFPGELVFGYGALLAEAVGVAYNALFLPVIDLGKFEPPPPGTRRDQVLFYASKYRKVHNREPFSLPDRAVEITRDEASAPDSATLVDLLRKADRIYLYENTALAIEAPLCGCVAVMMPNEHLPYPIGAADHGMGGIAWGDDPAELSRARETMGQMRMDYQAAIDRFGAQLEHFIEKTQAFADHERPIFLRGGPPRFGFSYSGEAAAAADRLLAKEGRLALLRKGGQILSERGPLVALGIVVRMMRAAVGTRIRVG